ncbi:hypothetical protein [uncultured Sphingomonas sp.]|uniref:tetratricopeptide repeat protein n=1 Tax=uncultured Sphingomonas sp. TaxID=158754 RepID=UPI0025FE95F8|nr:hypothetical protein [uncultured Sphingomonas sp.]
MTAALAEKRFADHPDGDPLSMTARLARRALLQDPTAVKAVSTLGLQAQMRGDARQARQFFDYAQRLSRRHLPTQLWAIEDAVARGDVAQALNHYDIALRTSNRAPDVLFPVLGSAISQADVRRDLIALLRQRPLWAGEFVGFVAAGGLDPKAAALVLQGVQNSGVPITAEAVAFLINRLLDAGATDAAWDFYASARGVKDRRTSRDPHFVANLSAPSVFDWTPINDAGIVTSMQRGPAGGLFDFATSSGAGGTILQQFELLPPGTYRLEGRSAGIEQPTSSLPYWMMSCQDGRETGRVAIPNSTHAGGRFVGYFIVPQACPRQILALVVRSSANTVGVTGQIETASLRPTNESQGH